LLVSIFCDGAFCCDGAQLIIKTRTIVVVIGSSNLNIHDFL